MSGEEEEFDIPSHIYRISHDDADRTRLLKDVLRSTAKLQEENGKKKNRGRLALKGQASPPARRDRSKKKATSQVTLTELAACQESDELFASIGSHDGEPSSLLATCGQRISGLCEKLRLSDKQLKIAAAEAKAAEACDTAPENEIRIMDRPEESLGTTRARKDRVVYEFVAKNAHFARLEEYKDKMDQAQGYEGLRKLVPERFKHHANMTFMDDTVLWDPSKLQDAIWKGPSQNPHTDLRTKLESRMAVGLKTNLANTSSLAQRRAARTMRLDHSAPALLSR